MDIRKTRGTIMKTIVTPDSRIVINITEDFIILSDIKGSVAFTTSIANYSDSPKTIERWLCVHMRGRDKDDYEYKETIKEINKALHCDIPLKNRYKRPHEIAYIMDGSVVHRCKEDEYYDSVYLGYKLANGDVSDVGTADDEYRISVGADMKVRIYDMPTGLQIFMFPLDTDHPDHLAILKKFKSEWLNYLRKFVIWKIERIQDPMKRQLIMAATKLYRFDQETMKKLVDTCIKYDRLSLVYTRTNNRVIGFLPNVLWIYQGPIEIVIRVYNEGGNQLGTLKFKNHN